MTTTTQRQTAQTTLPAQVVTPRNGSRRSARVIAAPLLFLALLSGGFIGHARSAAADEPDAGGTLPAYERPTNISTSPDFRWNFQRYPVR